MKKFEINKIGQDYFVGDLHGYYDKFLHALTQVDFNFEKDRVFSVGDLIDRGPKSIQTLELLNKPWFNAVLGNHEEFMMWYPQRYGTWVANGGHWAIPVIESGNLSKYIKMVENLPLTMEVDTEWGKIGVVHAESHQDWSKNGPNTRERNLWARTKIEYRDVGLVKGINLVVVGHTPVKSPIKLGNVVYIDVGAYFQEREVMLLTPEQLFTL